MFLINFFANCPADFPSRQLYFANFTDCCARFGWLEWSGWSEWPVWMICIQKVHGLHGLNQQIIPKSWYSHMWHTNGHTCESRAVFCSGRIRNNLMDQMQEYEEIILKKWGQSLLFWILTMKCCGLNIVLRNFMKCLKFCWCLTFDWPIASLDQMSSTMVSYFIVCFHPHDEDFEKSMYTMKFNGNILS